MKAELLALAAMAALSTGALASSFGHLNRMEEADVAHPGAISNDIYLKGFGLAAGLIQCQSESAATVDGDQQGEDNAIGAGVNNALRGHAALFGAQGNNGVNLAAGTGSGLRDCGCVPVNDAVMNGFALAGARGNIGINIGAGVGNALSNGLTISNSAR